MDLCANEFQKLGYDEHDAFQQSTACPKVFTVKCNKYVKVGPFGHDLCRVNCSYVYDKHYNTNYSPFPWGRIIKIIL